MNSKEAKKISPLMWVVIIIAILVLSRISGNLMGKSAAQIELQESSMTEQYRDLWVKACMAKNSESKYCNCTFDYIRDKLSQAEVVKANKDFEETGLMDNRIVEAAQYCKTSN